MIGSAVEATLIARENMDVEANMTDEVVLIEDDAK
jgi:hypothetical protein